MRKGCDKLIRVLQYGMSYNPGGIERYLLEQVKAISREKMHYDFFSYGPICYSDELLHYDCDIHYVIEENRWKRILKTVRFFLNYRKKYDILVMNEAPLLYGVFFVAVAWLVGIKRRVIHVHNSFYRGKYVGKKRLLQHFIAKLFFRWGLATDFFACSQKAGITMFGNNVPFRVIHNAFYVEDYFYQPEIRKKIRLTDGFIVGHVGSFNEEKNHEFLIKTFAEIKKHIANAELWMIGAFDDNSERGKMLKSLVINEDLESSVRFLGIQSNVGAWLQAFDVFIFPSRSEGLGIAVLEAQAAGVPCVVSDSLPEEVRVTSAIEFLSLNKSPQEWANVAMSFNGRNNKQAVQAFIDSPYNISRQICKLTSLYESMCR